MPIMRREFQSVADIGADAVGKVKSEAKAGIHMVKRLDIFSKWKASTCKTQLKMAKVRANGHVLRCAQEIHHVRKQVVGYLEKGQWEKARLKCEHVLLLQAEHDAFDVLESLCDLLMTRTSQIDLETSVPADLRNVIASVLYCRGKMDVPELQEVQRQFRLKYGKTWLEALERVGDRDVHPRVVEFCKYAAPTKRQVRSAIAGIVDDFQLSFATLGMIDDMQAAFESPKSDFAVTPVMAPRRPDCGTPVATKDILRGDFGLDSLDLEEAGSPTAPVSEATGTEARSQTRDVASVAVDNLPAVPKDAPGAAKSKDDAESPKAPICRGDEFAKRLEALRMP